MYGQQFSVLKPSYNKTWVWIVEEVFRNSEQQTSVSENLIYTDHCHNQRDLHMGFCIVVCMSPLKEKEVKLDC